MKITELPVINKAVKGDIAIIDGSKGTKQISLDELLFSVLGFSSKGINRCIFRGANLGNQVTQEQLNSIKDGSFDDLWLGDYWLINGVKWRIVDFNYWKRDSAYNDQPTINHLVIMPDEAVGRSKMNDTNTSVGGYASSVMYTVHMKFIKSIVTSAFGSSLISRKDYLSTGIATDGTVTAQSILDSTIDLPSEFMLFGGRITSRGPFSGNSPQVYLISFQQFSLFRVRPDMLVTGYTYWLKDVATNTQFVAFSSDGLTTSGNASNVTDCRPVFAIG